MPRVPRPEELPRAGLEPANEPPTINPNVASRIGESGRAMGRAISSLGAIAEAFGEVGGKIAQTQDAQSLANARLDWMRQDHEIQTDLASRAGEDGAGWQAAPDRYRALNEDLGKRYQFNNPNTRLQWETWREQNTARRGFDAARAYQEGQRNTFVRSFDSDVAGFAQRIESGDIDPETFNQYRAALQEKLGGMNRRIMSEAEIQAKTRELEGRLVGSIDKYLANKDPAERERFWGQVRGGRYEIDKLGPQSAVPTGLGAVSAKYESGGRGVGFISSGKNDPGGQSYGVHQLSGAYSMGAFLRSPEGKPYADAFAGSRPMTPQFNATYKAIAARDPEGFAAAQKAFYTRTHYEPARAHAEKAGFDTTNRGVQEALFSIGVQHGGAKTIISRAAGAAGGSPEQQIRALYAARSRYVQGVALPADTKASVLNRYVREEQDALRLAGQKAEQPTAPAQTQPVRVAQGPAVQSDVQTDAGSGSDGAAPKPALTEEQQAENDPAGEYDAKPQQAQGQAGGQAAPANDNRAPQAPGSVPMGRLAPGQVFTIKTPKGEIQVTSEQINALPAKQREAMNKASGDAYRIYQASRQSLAKEMMENAETSASLHGKPGPNYDPALIREVYAKQPELVRKHAQRMQINTAMFNQLRDLADMEPNEIAHRLTELETTYLNEGNPDIAANKRMFDQVARRAIKHLEQRETDPGGAVETSFEVKSVRSKLVGGVPRNKMDAQALADARLTAQARLGIPEDRRSPITAREAEALGTTLGGLNSGDAAASVKRLHERVEKEWGSTYSGVIVRRVIEEVVRGKQKSEAFAGALQELDENETISPTTLERAKTLAELGRRERELPAPKPAPEEKPGLLGRLYQMLPTPDWRAAGSGQQDSDYMRGQMPQPEATPPKVFPTPAADHIARLKKNPQSVDQFEEIFGPGSAEKAIPGLGRMLKMQGLR